KPWSAPYLHLFAETAKLCFHDRIQHLGDPDFVKIPVDLFLSEDSAREKAKLLHTRWAERSAAPDPSSEDSHTSNVSIIDLAVNLIYFHASAKESAHAPRIHTEGPEPLAISLAVPEEVADELQSLGHTLVRGTTVGGISNDVAGLTNVVSIDPKTGEAQACS